MKYSAIAKNDEQVLIIRNQEFKDAGEFYQYLKMRGFSVNPKMIKPSKVFDYIMENTNCSPWDWEREINPEEV